MLGQQKKKEAVLRVFNIGIIGASKEAFEALSRIFNVTRYRTRSYRAHLISSNATYVESSIDMLILCTTNPRVVEHWTSKIPRGAAVERPLIRVSRKQASDPGEYVITVPVNPSRLLKQLDQYTIRELRFFPEFKIGSEGELPSASAEAGIRLLKSHMSGANKRQGLQRALVVDDSLAVRRQVQIEFELLETEVDLASTAEQALQFANTTAYDIICMDVVMPGMDGYSACKKIKKTALNKQTPVVLLTSRSSSFDKFKGALAGCDTYLIKPINHNDFLDLVGKYFNEVNALPA